MPRAEGEDFLVILFNKDERLRSHAVSHFMNRTEQEDWEAILGYSTGTLLAECEQSLRELGMPPHYSQNPGGPLFTGDNTVPTVFFLFRID